MANLIITIIAIALVAVAALMGAYYGGTAFNQGQEQAKLSTLINEGSQIVAALTMYDAMEDANFVFGTDDLDDLKTGNYLTSGITGWTIAANTLTKTTDAETCALAGSDNAGATSTCNSDGTTFEYNF
ncbi:MAG: hypothetical protein N4A43_02855 [Alphaproteobacteria bacterium]|jgi:hypothetical protein|nr:hypothetical protein [Alphaproteobacteria bacterium]